MRVALLLSVLSWLCHTGAADDFLQLEVWGKGDGSVEALADLELNRATYANQFVSSEGSSSYKLVEPGSSLPVARNRREEEGSNGGHQHLRQLDVGCPNKCSKSSSTYCLVLGCANCGKCGGRRQLEDCYPNNNSKNNRVRFASQGRSRGRSLQIKSATEQRQIESDIGSDVAKYCAGRVNCSLYARILRRYDNGTVVRAN